MMDEKAYTADLQYLKTEDLEKISKDIHVLLYNRKRDKEITDALVKLLLIAEDETKDLSQMYTALEVLLSAMREMDIVPGREIMKTVITRYMHHNKEVL